MAQYPKIVTTHRAWLARQGLDRSRQWEARFALNEESAVFEACVRELLQTHDVVVEPAEDASSGGPDFRCSVGGSNFYVECTCLSIDAVARHTGLPVRFVPNSGARNYRDLTALIRAEGAHKTPQCSGLEAPCLLAVGTFHFMASSVCCSSAHAEHVLTSTTGISMAFDSALGEAVGPMIPTTDLRFSSVVRPNRASGIETARQPISGYLVCGFGGLPWHISGVLHPNPRRAFVRELLAAMPFCRLKPGWETGNFTVEWV